MPFAFVTKLNEEILVAPDHETTHRNDIEVDMIFL